MKLFGLMLLLCLAQAVHADEPLKFGVANQRPVMLTAQIWNPIPAYFSRNSGVPLALSMEKTATETTELSTNGELDFIYTDQLFTPERNKLGFIDLSVLKQAIGNNPERLYKLASKYLESTHAALVEIEAALMQNDLPSLAKIGHRIKSSSRTVARNGNGRAMSAA